MRSLLFFMFVAVLAEAGTAQNLTLHRVYELENDVRLESLLKDYFVVEGDVSQIVSSYQGGSLSINLEKGPQFDLGLESVEVVDKNYRLIADDGVNVTRRSSRSAAISSYRGDAQGQRVSLTTAPQFLQGRLVDEEGVLYYIEPAKTLLPDAPNSSFLVYRTSDVLEDPNAVCGNSAVENREREAAHQVAHQTSNGQARAGECLNIDLAIASAHDMYVLRGSSVAATEAFIVAIINDMDVDYETVFDYDVNFTIVEQYVSTSLTSTLDVALGTDDRSVDLLNSFEPWAEGANGFTASYDLGNIWTARDIYNLDNMGMANYGVVGTAWRPGICNDGSNYAVFESFTTTGWQLRVLQSHETGHNFNMVHDETINPNIMWPSVLNTTVWTTGSISDLTGRVDGATCLNSTTLPLEGSPYADFSQTGLCKNQIGSPEDLSARLPTSYTWTSAGASITGASTSTPTVSYSTAGTKSINLSVSNANCGGAAGTETKSVEVINYDAPAAACAVSSTNLGTGGTFGVGITNVTFGTVNYSSSYTFFDGTYTDVICQDYTSVAAASVPFSITVGPSNNHRIKILVDVNNDGTFAVSEELHDQTGIAPGSTITPTITLPVSTLSGTLLRVRIMSDFNSMTVCSDPIYGEVEDFGLILSAPLPVEMTSISTNVKGSEIGVNWSVAQEVDVNYYRVEHSRDGRTWANAGKVDATNTLAAQAYSFDHGKQSAGTHYYRVTSVDFDGSQQTSEVVTARVNNVLNGEVSLAPNPTQNGWSTLSINRSFEAGSVTIIDGLGRQISQKQLSASSENREVLLDLTAQPKGTYWVVLVLDGEQSGMRLIK